MAVESTTSRSRTQRETATERLLRAYRQGGDVRARDRIVQIYLPLVDTFARRYEGAGARYEELRRAGSIGLLCAIQGHFPGRGEEFVGFAVPMITDEIKAQLGYGSSGAAASNGAPGFDLRDERLQLAAAFRALDPREYEVFQLRFVDELSSVEVASRLELSEDQVADLAHAAMVKLRDELEALASGQPPAAPRPMNGEAEEPRFERPHRRAKETHSGRLLLRMRPELHTELASAARRDGMSLNQFITKTLAATLSSAHGEVGGDEKPASAPRWLQAAVVTNIVVLIIAAILAAIMLLVAWHAI